MKVVINTEYGGFGLSHKAVMRYADLKGIKLYASVDDRINGNGWRKFLPYNEGDDAFIIYYNRYPLSKEGKHKEGGYWSYRDLERNDPILIQVVEEMGEEANGRCAKLSIVEIPDDVKWQIEEYDGLEWVAEKHRTWR